MAADVATAPPPGGTPAVADPHAYLHHRVTLYIKTLLVAFVFMALMAVPKALFVYFSGHAEYLQYRLADVIFFLFLAGLTGQWLFLRRRRRSIHILHAIESAGTFCGSLMVAVLVAWVPQGFPTIAVLFVVVLQLVLRAAIVPSSGRRTFIVGLASTAAVSVGVYVHGDSLPNATIFELGMWIAVAFWGAMFSFVTAFCSRVIFGLQEQVREAMQLGNYTLDHKLGEGGMGVVYLARHQLLKRPTAIKLLRGEADERTLARFEREVQESSRLAHPNTVEIYDYGRTPDGIFYYVMEYLDGVTLDDLVELDGPQPAARVVYILEQVAHALAHAHALGLIHRDIKPANIVLCDRGGVADMAKVVDFGLVKDITAPADAHLTAANTVTGTPMYMAPECLQTPDEVDGRVDIYALGAVGYFLLTGRPVFEGRTMVEICGHHLHSQPEPLADQCELSPELEELILSCLEKQPDDRPSDGEALHRALQACPDAEQWGLAEATAWWREHGARVAALHQGREVPMTEPTVVAARAAE